MIEREKLQANSLKIGNHISRRPERLKEKHNIIGDVRGKGLMLGIELVKDRATKEPAKAECAQVMETCKEMGLLLGKGGLRGQTIRFSPPMCITKADADFLLEVLDQAFGHLYDINDHLTTTTRGVFAVECAWFGPPCSKKKTK